MLKVGIVGLPNAGKSTLFNALVEKPKARTATHPFTTVDKNIGTVSVPDDLLFKLASLENIGKVTPVSITFIDIAGLIKGAHQGEGLGNQFLHHIREVNLILHVIRFFDNPQVPHVHATIDPESDLKIVNEELLLADLESLEKKLNKEKLAKEEKELVEYLIKELNQGKMASEILPNLEEKQQIMAKFYHLLTAKKQIVVANIDEEDLNNPPTKINNTFLLPIAAKFEAELNELPWVEQQKILKDLGLKSSAKTQIIQSCYQNLDLITFYTIAKRTEARAWPIKKGAKAIEAAEKIHSDFGKHFVKVEVITAEELIKIGGWNKAKEIGKIILEGREYQVKNQDVLEFKISLH